MFVVLFPSCDVQISFEKIHFQTSKRQVPMKTGENSEKCRFYFPKTVEKKKSNWHVRKKKKIIVLIISLH